MTQLNGPCLLLIPVILVSRAFTDPGAPVALDPKTRLQYMKHLREHKEPSSAGGITHTLSFAGPAAAAMLPGPKQSKQDHRLRGTVVNLRFGYVQLRQKE